MTHGLSRPTSQAPSSLISELFLTLIHDGDTWDKDAEDSRKQLSSLLLPQPPSPPGSQFPVYVSRTFYQTCMGACMCISCFRINLTAPSTQHCPVLFSLSQKMFPVRFTQQIFTEHLLSVILQSDCPAPRSHRISIFTFFFLFFSWLKHKILLL